MNRLLYYPYFEIQNSNWIKFALLYAEKVNLIVPEEGDRFLSYDFRDLYESTDLLRLYRPKHEVSYPASLDAIEEIEKILRNPNIYNRSFNLNGRRNHVNNFNIVDKWRNNHEYNFELFDQKYTWEFSSFCRENQLAEASHNGIRLSKELAHLYMALLARVIGDKENYSPISDEKQYDYVINRLRMSHEGDESTVLARNVVEAKLPKNMNRIDLFDVIQLRNSHGFSNKLRSFHSALDDFQTTIETCGIDEEDQPLEFINKYEKPFNDMIEEVSKLSLDLTNFGIGTWLVMNDPEYIVPAGFKEIVIGGMIIYSGRRIKIKKTWARTRNNMLVRSYLTGINRIDKTRFKTNKKQ